MDKTLIEVPFKDLLINLASTDMVFGLIVPTTDDWEYPLPNDRPDDYFIIMIQNWTKEETHFTADGVYVKTAFGQSENNKFFPYTEIRGVVGSNMNPLFLKPYDTTKANKSIVVPKNISMKDIMHDEEGNKKSMEAILKNNPHLRK